MHYVFERTRTMQPWPKRLIILSKTLNWFLLLSRIILALNVSPTFVKMFQPFRNQGLALLAKDNIIVIISLVISEKVLHFSFYLQIFATPGNHMWSSKWKVTCWAHHITAMQICPLFKWFSTKERDTSDLATWLRLS